MTTTVPAAEMIAALEAEGTPSPESIAAVRATLAAELAAISARLFPPAVATPTTADALAGYEWIKGRLPHSRFDVLLAEAHRTALADNAGVAALCRTAEALEDVGNAAAIVANPLAAAAAGQAAIRRFQLAISTTLCEGTDAPSDARAFLETIALEDRIAAVEARAVERAAAAAEAVAEAARAAVRAKREERKARIAEAAQAEQTMRAGYEAAVRTHQRIRAETLAERVAASGLTEIRDHLGRLWAVKDLILVAGDGTAELPPHYELGVLERALDRHEAAQEVSS